MEWEHESGSDTIRWTPGASWIAVDWLELDLEIPAALVVAEDAPTVGSLGDVSAAAQVRVCCGPRALLDYLSLRAEVAAPSGSRGKDIDGTGSWAVSLLPGRRFTVAESLPDLMVQAELAYGQDIRPVAAAEDAGAAQDGADRVRKAFVWNLAFAQAYLAGRLRPVVELLGTTTVDAASEDDENTVVELAFGAWAVPFEDDHALSPLSAALGFRFPVGPHREIDAGAILVLQWSFGGS